MTSWIPAIAHRSGPRYRAIADALADDVAQGRLGAGDRLPTHRELSARLGVTVGTITRAYAEAEKRGLIGGEVGRGTFVQTTTTVPATATGHVGEVMSSAAGMGERSSAPWPRSAPWPTQSAGPGVATNAIDMTLAKPQQREAQALLPGTLREIAAKADPAELLGYAPHAGLRRHRVLAADWINRWHHTFGLEADDLVITTGAQNAMAVALATVTRPGDVILTEKLSYYGLKVLAATLGLHLEGVALDEHGLVPDAFDSVCRRLGPKALCTVPTLQNPTALLSPEGRRRELADIARRHGVYIIEDDVFGFLVDNAHPYQTIAPDISLFLTSLSKSIAAGLRIGYVAAPPILTPRVEATVRALQFSTPVLPVEVAARWMEQGVADQLAANQKQDDAERQRLARSILPASCIHGHPNAEHLWVTLPEPWRRDEFVNEARRRGVLLTGAEVFMVGRASAPHAVRIGLAQPDSHGQLKHALRILADMLGSPPTTGLGIL